MEWREFDLRALSELRICTFPLLCFQFYHLLKLWIKPFLRFLLILKLYVFSSLLCSMIQNSLTKAIHTLLTTQQNSTPIVHHWLKCISSSHLNQYFLIFLKWALTICAIFNWLKKPTASTAMLWSKKKKEESCKTNFEEWRFHIFAS